MTALPVLFCAVAVGVLLLGQARDERRLIWISKPLAAACFLWAAIAWGALESAYGVTILAGLALCAVGDVALIPRGRAHAFLVGIGAFLLGHVAYAVAFARQGFAPGAALGATVGMAAFIWVLLRWLWPHVSPGFRGPVVAYVGVISVMVVCAIATVAAGAMPAAAIGAIAFAASDVSVARDRFVAPGFVNGAWGLPLYFGAQLVLASTV